MISDNYANLAENHFARAVTCNVGEGEEIPFWYSYWAGNQLLRETFPELFALLVDHLLSVTTVGRATDMGWVWNSAVLFSDGLDARCFLWQPLVFFLQQVLVLQNAEDTYKWAITADGSFSVKACYDRFKEKPSSPTLNFNTILALNHLWKIKVLSKIHYFGWRIILNRITNKDQLHKRGIAVVSNDLLCVF